MSSFASSSVSATEASVSPSSTGIEAQGLQTGWIDLIKHRWIYLGISLLLLLPGTWFLAQNLQTPPHHPVRLGIDFVGGTLLEYGAAKPISQESVLKIKEELEAEGLHGSLVQVRQAAKALEASPKTEPTASEVKPSTTTEPNGKASAYRDILSIRTKLLSQPQLETLQKSLQAQFGTLTLLQQNSVGPTLANELLRNGLIALGLAYLLIVLYLTLRFQIDFAICAMVALLHDSLFVFGLFALLGAVFGTEIDGLFITALLTVVGFSVHDTIVVFDRIRENARLLYSKRVPFREVVNLSVNQTLTRSINTSLTCLLSLLALYLLGGSTIKDFVFCMLVGIAVGTFSSIFIASLLLAWWREKQGSDAAARKVA
jgi:preprotein translocase subunit SecF